MMERRGIYRKGSQGHARNVNPYRFYIQRMKKWRIPLTALLALVLVFGTAPVVGEEFQASVLTPEQTAVASANPEELRKAVLNALKSFVDDCKQFKISKCEDEGGSLLNRVIYASASDVGSYVASAEDFSVRFGKEVAKAACRYDLFEAFVQTKSVRKALEEFLEKYGEDFDEVPFTNAQAEMAKAESALQEIIDFCEE